MSQPDYLKKAVGAALADGFLSEGIGEENAEQAVEAVIRKAEPFIAEHHRADERARVEGRVIKIIDEWESSAAEDGWTLASRVTKALILEANPIQTQEGS